MHDAGLNVNDAQLDNLNGTDLLKLQPSHAGATDVKSRNKEAPRNLQKISQAIESNVTKFSIETCEKMSNEVLPGMRSDDITKFIKNDKFILDYGNYLCNRHK